MGKNAPWAQNKNLKFGSAHLFDKKNSGGSFLSHPYVYIT